MRKFTLGRNMRSRKWMAGSWEGRRRGPCLRRWLCLSFCSRARREEGRSGPGGFSSRVGGRGGPGAKSTPFLQGDALKRQQQKKSDLTI